MSNGQVHWRQQPAEIWYLIFQLASGQTWLQFDRCCRSFYRLLTDEEKIEKQAQAYRQKNKVKIETLIQSKGSNLFWCTQCKCFFKKNLHRHLIKCPKIKICPDCSYVAQHYCSHFPFDQCPLEKCSCGYCIDYTNYRFAVKKHSLHCGKEIVKCPGCRSKMTKKRYMFHHSCAARDHITSCF